MCEVWIALFTGLQKDTRSWCQIGTWKPLKNDTKIALSHSGKEVTEFCSVTNVLTLTPIAKMELDPLERFCPVSTMCICIKKSPYFFDL